VIALSAALALISNLISLTTIVVLARRLQAAERNATATVASAGDT
jgi:hypothetical protein